MLHRDRNTQSIAWVRDQLKLNNIDLDPPYQRKSVCNRKFKQYFIDSILRNYPVPAILVAEEVLDDGSGRIIYHVIDGKQRLTSILEFLNGEYPVGRESLSVFQGKYFTDLDTATRTQFLSYKLPFEIFKLGDDADVTVNNIYERFNKNVARLNEQELRKAKFDGEFARTIEDLANALAEDPFWRNLKLFTQTAIRRMYDVEFVAELYILTKAGIQEPGILDDYYAEYDEGIPDHNETYIRFMQIKAELEKIAEAGLDFRATRYSNLSDFYSLWAATGQTVAQKKRVNYKKTAEKLAEFSEDVASAAPSYAGARKPSEDGLKYSDAVRQGANKKTNREERANILFKRFEFLT